MSGPPPPVPPPPTQQPATQSISSPPQEPTTTSNIFKNVQLKKTEPTRVKNLTGNNTKIFTKEMKPTVQRPYDGPPQVILVISRHWVVFEWIEPAIKKILFTTPSSYEAMCKTNPDAKKEYIHIELFNELTSGLVEWKAEELFKIYQFTHIVGFAEEDLIRTARIRNSLGIKYGQNVESALRYRDKVIMKTILRENNLKVPNFAVVESASDVIDFVKKNGIEVVVKPRKGYSSVNTWIIKSQNDLETFLSSGFNSTNGFDSALDLEIETFIHGQMYHIDGIVYDGEVKLCCPSCYVNICADFKNSKFLGSYTLSSTNPLYHRLQQYTVDCIKALGGPSCFPFHCEAWVTPDDEIVFCEIASRTGGAWVRHVIWRQYEIMQDKTFIQWQVQQEITHPELGNNWKERESITTELAGWIFIYPQVGIVHQIPKECSLPFVAFSETFGSIGDKFLSRLNCVDSIFSAVYTGKDETEMVQNAHALYKWFEENTIYLPIQ